MGPTCSQAALEFIYMVILQKYAVLKSYDNKGLSYKSDVRLENKKERYFWCSLRPTLYPENRTHFFVKIFMDSSIIINGIYQRIYGLWQQQECELLSGDFLCYKLQCAKQRTLRSVIIEQSGRWGLNSWVKF